MGTEKHTHPLPVNDLHSHDGDIFQLNDASQQTAFDDPSAKPTLPWLAALMATPKFGQAL